MRLRDFTLTNIRFALQGHYRAFIIRQYVKFNLTNDDLAIKITQHKNCLGTCKSCGCPMAELLLTDKTCNCDEHNQ